MYGSVPAGGRAGGACMQIYTHTSARAHTCTHARTLIHSHTHTLTHATMHTRSHARTHTHHWSCLQHIGDRIGSPASSLRRCGAVRLLARQTPMALAWVCCMVRLRCVTVASQRYRASRLPRMCMSRKGCTRAECGLPHTDGHRRHKTGGAKATLGQKKVRIGCRPKLAQGEEIRRGAL